MLVRNYAVGIYGKSHYEDKDALLDKGARLFFVTPWMGHSIVGTALSYYDGNPDQLNVTAEDIQKFLDEFNAAYPDAKLKREDVSFVHRGFLPSSGPGSKTNDVQISKKYQILDHRKDGIYGLISVIGVKYTTARDVAEKTLDHVFSVWNRRSSKSLSSTTPVYGGKIERFDDFLTEQMNKYPSQVKDSIKSLVYNYGSAYSKVMKGLSLQSTQKLKSEDILRAEVLYGIREEMAMKLEDIVMRRTEVGAAGNPGEKMLSFCASVMGEELRWSAEKIRREMEEIHKIYAFFD
jgi:glycerol-3-phosphate dehydrogenase